MTHDEQWINMWKAYIDFIKKNKRCPSKYNPEDKKLVNWAKYNRKVRNRGDLTGDRLKLFKKLTNLSAKYRRVNQFAYLKKKSHKTNNQK